ncbi:MAG: toll/interleukin-1 receptor domain-containing protein [Planctomycetota bacterium]|jgi:hypothetical protein
MLKVFVSYSHHDRRWVARDSPDNLIPFLADSLRRHGVDFWYDHALIAGDRFQQEIESQIDRADLAILLVSQHFFNSDFIREVELPLIEARADAGELTVIPVLVGHCDWKVLRLVGDRHMLPGGPTGSTRRRASHLSKRTLARGLPQARNHSREHLDLSDANGSVSQDWPSSQPSFSLS